MSDGGSPSLFAGKCGNNAVVNLAQWSDSSAATRVSFPRNTV